MFIHQWLDIQTQNHQQKTSGSQGLRSFPSPPELFPNRTSCFSAPFPSMSLESIVPEKSFFGQKNHSGLISSPFSNPQAHTGGWTESLLPLFWRGDLRDTSKILSTSSSWGRRGGRGGRRPETGPGPLPKPSFLPSLSSSAAAAWFDSTSPRGSQPAGRPVSGGLARTLGAARLCHKPSSAVRLPSSRDHQDHQPGREVQPTSARLPTSAWQQLLRASSLMGGTPAPLPS